MRLILLFIIIMKTISPPKKFITQIYFINRLVRNIENFKVKKIIVSLFFQIVISFC